MAKTTNKTKTTKKATTTEKPVVGNKEEQVIEQTPAEEQNVGETVTETPVESPVEAPVETENQDVKDAGIETVDPTMDGSVKEMAAVANKKPKYGTDDDNDQPPTPPTPPVDPELTEPENNDPEPKAEEQESNQNKFNAENMQKELMTAYSVRYAFSQTSKKYSVLRNMTLFNMIDVFVKNRTAFVGCTSQANFDHIKDYVLHNPIIYMYQELQLEGRKQFIERLEMNTNYVLEHLTKK